MKKGLKLALFGPPGAGKGTQAGRLAGFLACPHISTGDMFRAMQTSMTELGGRIREILGSGQLVPDELVTKMTFDRLDQQDAVGGFILDGFPRTLAQAIALQGSSYALDGLIEIRVRREEIIQRLSGRRVCENCKAIFHLNDLTTASGLCRICQGKLILREDDRPEAVATRLDVFEANLAPVVRFYRERNLLLSIDGCGDPDAVFGRLVGELERLGP